MYIWIAGFCTGFTGYLMVNNINLCLLELQQVNKRVQAFFFVFWVLLFEALYCIGSLRGMKLLLQFPAWVLVARITAIVFLLIIGAWTLLEKRNEPEERLRKNIILRGYWSVFVHPQQIPFWLFWGLLLTDKGIMKAEDADFLILAGANSLGALLVLVLYWRVGNQIIERFAVNRRLLKNLVGVICLLSAAFLLADIIRP